MRRISLLTVNNANEMTTGRKSETRIFCQICGDVRVGRGTCIRVTVRGGGQSLGSGQPNRRRAWETGSGAERC